MITVTGNHIFIENNNAPSLFDIGTGLSRTIRFAGQTVTPYTVLAHTFTVTSLVPEEYKIFALLHDAAESIVGDQVSTWKNHSTKHSEETILKRIFHSLGLSYPMSGEAHEAVRNADLLALRAEAQVLGHGKPDHESFLRIPLSEDAVKFTQDNLRIPLDQWMRLGWSGQRYADAANNLLARFVKVVDGRASEAAPVNDEGVVGGSASPADSSS